MNNNLMTRFNNRVNSFERNNADGPAAVNPAATQLASSKGNPSFAAQFDIQFLTKYFTLVDATGVFTVSTAAAVAAAVPALATQLAAFLYGNSDFVSPTSFKMPEQFQPGIIDVPIKKGIDKQVALASYVNYDAISVQWSLFVEYVEKLAF